MANLNKSLTEFSKDCKHRVGLKPSGGSVCKTCAIAWAREYALDEIEKLFKLIQTETGHLTLASLLVEYHSKKD